MKYRQVTYMLIVMYAFFVETSNVGTIKSHALCCFVHFVL